MVKPPYSMYCRQDILISVRCTCLISQLAMQLHCSLLVVLPLQDFKLIVASNCHQDHTRNARTKVVFKSYLLPILVVSCEIHYNRIYNNSLKTYALKYCISGGNVQEDFKTPSMTMSIILDIISKFNDNLLCHSLVQILHDMHAQNYRQVKHTDRNAYTLRRQPSQAHYGTAAFTINTCIFSSLVQWLLPCAPKTNFHQFETPLGPCCCDLGQVTLFLSVQRFQL